jgi:hypothetical protein
MRARLVLLVVGLLAWSAGAQDQRPPEDPAADAPAETATTQSSPRRSRPMTMDDWRDMDEFSRRYSPRRWQAVRSLDAAQQERIAGMMALRRGWLRRLQQGDPELYELRVQRISAEDLVFGLRQELDKVEGEQAAKVRDMLRSAVRELVQVALKERQIRLERFAERLKQERQRLSEDQGRVDQLIEQRLEAVEKHTGGPLFQDSTDDTNLGGEPGQGQGRGRGQGGPMRERARQRTGAPGGI